MPDKTENRLAQKGLKPFQNRQIESDKATEVV